MTQSVGPCTNSAMPMFAQRLTRRKAIWATAALALLFAACGAFEQSDAVPTATPTGTNLLADPGFEGAAPAWVEFPPVDGNAVIATPAHTGSSSVVLRLRPDVGALAIAQSTHPQDFPEFTSGFYRTDNWREGGAYLQFVVKVAGGAAESVSELRFVIAGTATEPEPAPQARYIFLSRAPQPSGEWTYFSYPIRRAFADNGGVPARWDSLDISMEIHAVGGEESTATAYFDDVYLGTQAGNPNHPTEKRH